MPGPFEAAEDTRIMEQQHSAEKGEHINNSTRDITGHSHDADDAILAFEGVNGEQLLIDEETNKRLLRKIDWHIMPFMAVIFGMNIIDKSTLSFAESMGLKEDINLVGDNYQWLGSIFFIGYFFWSYPTSRLLQRLPLAKYSTFCILAWGLFLTCLAAVTNFTSAAALRFFLGMFESNVMPSFALVTSQWYRTEEQAVRTAIWYSAIGFGYIFGSLLGYGIAVATRVYGAAIAAWRTLFLATGIPTMALGVWFWWVVPDSQLNARWLSPKDRVLAVERVRGNQQGIGNKYFKMDQFKETLKDPISWAFFFYSLIVSIPVGGIVTFYVQLVQSFGYSKEQSLLYGAPAGAVMVGAVFTQGFLGSYLRQRLLVGASILAVAVMGMALIVGLPASNNVGRLIGYYFACSSTGAFSAVLGMISSNVAGYTKKTTVAAMYVVGYGVGNIIGPQTFRPKDAPEYTPAKVNIIACNSVCILIMVIVWWWYRRQNAKKAIARAKPGYRMLENQEWLDLTDTANDEFIYAL